LCLVGSGLHQMPVQPLHSDFVDDSLGMNKSSRALTAVHLFQLLSFRLEPMTSTRITTIQHMSGI